MNKDTGIRFMKVDADVPLTRFLDHLTSVEELIRVGAVYVDGKRQREDLRLAIGQVVRVHTRRKRFPAAELGGWRRRLVHDHPGFVVLDKPSGLPTHATLDNFEENAKFVLERELGCSLYTTHRLDVPTAGLLILAKTAEAQTRLNGVFARGLVSKIYHAVSHARLAPGAYRHFLNPETHVPRTVAREARPGWWDCRLRIEATGHLRDGNHWHRVRLLTGKTHQIRAQFTAEGAPLVGDETYGGVPGPFGLECYEMSVPFGSEIFTFRRPRSLLT